MERVSDLPAVFLLDSILCEVACLVLWLCVCCVTAMCCVYIYNNGVCVWNGAVGGGVII